MLPKQNASKRETALLQQPQAFAHSWAMGAATSVVGTPSALHKSTWPLVLRRPARGCGEGYLDTMLPKQSTSLVP
jgi:hypothetical protein